MKKQNKPLVKFVKKYSVKQQLITASMGVICSLAFSASAIAGSLDQAKRIHDRLAGVPPTAETLLLMQADIDGAGGPMAAAARAMEHDAFYNVTIKNWAAPWTNEEFDVFVPLNDYTATVVGLVRDSAEIDFREVLYGDHIYTASGLMSAPESLPAYSSSDNAHYEALEAGNYSLKDNLVHQSQAAVTELPAEATAGVVTTRAAGKSFFIDGTNRANFRFTLVNHLCLDLEQVHDVTRVPDRIRQDVSRSPGGDSRVFSNTCLGCHSGMDPLAQAFAYYDYEYDTENDLTGENGRIVYNTEGMTDLDTGTRVTAKHHFNGATFPFGYIIPDDKWDNYWREGQNSNLGWDESLDGTGNGASSMLQELAHSEAFASCQVKKVFEAVCLRKAQDSDDREQLNTMLGNFTGDGFNIKNVFAESAVYCAGS